MLAHLAHIGAALGADPGNPAGVRQGHANRREVARVFHGVTQAVDTVTLHQPHRAGIVVRPDRLAAMLARLGLELLGHDVERVAPRNLAELFRSLRTGPAQRLHQPIRMMDALGVARHLLADHARGVVVALRAADPTDAPGIQPLDIEGAGAGAIVRADGRHDGDPRLGVLGSYAARIGMIVWGHGDGRSAGTTPAYSPGEPGESATTCRQNSQSTLLRQVFAAPSTLTPPPSPQSFHRQRHLRARPSARLSCWTTRMA